MYLDHLYVTIMLFVTPPRNHGGVIFSLQFVCVCVCLSGSACKQNSSQTDPPIWTWFLLKMLLPALAQTLLNLVKGQGHSDVIPIFFHNSLLTSLPCISALMFDQNEIWYVFLIYPWSNCV